MKNTKIFECPECNGIDFYVTSKGLMCKNCHEVIITDRLDDIFINIKKKVDSGQL